MFLEDQVWPKRCGHMAGKQVRATRGMAGQAAAPRSTHAQHLFVTARTDARAAVGLDEALERARMAADLGVDAIFVEAPESRRGAGGASSPPSRHHARRQHDRDRTDPAADHRRSSADLGFDLIVSPLSGLFAMVRTLRDTYGYLRTEGSMREHLSDLVSFDEFTDLVELDRHLARNPDEA